MGKVTALKRKEKRRKILIVDDEQMICEVIAELVGDSFEPVVANSGAQALEMARKENPALILMDIIMPGVNGMSTCESLRDDPLTKHIPIIMLSAAGSLENRINSFNNGADDFVGKPFDAEELISRINSKLRRIGESKANRKDILVAENLTLDKKRSLAIIDDEKISLSDLEQRLLNVLVKKKDQMVTRKEILSKVWKKQAVPDRIIDAHIVALRKKLRNFRGELKTVYGKGYILTSSPTQIERGTA